jgi:hypothetical protein
MVKTDIAEIQASLVLASQEIPDGVYHHYKGTLYRVCGYSWLTKSNEVGITYYDVETGVTFTRPISSWLAPVDGKSRFERVASW